MSIKTKMLTITATAAFVIGAAAIVIGTTPRFGDKYDIGDRFMPGVNLAGAAFFTTYRPDGTRAEHGVEYAYPATKFFPDYRADYFLKKGMSVFRLPFSWERIQHEPGGPLDKAELDRLRTTVQELVGMGAWVILDLHNYARYEGEVIGGGKASVADFAELWKRLAKQFADNPNIAFGLMNEPYDIDTDLWVDAANQAIAAIRETDAKNYILVGGNGFSATRHWYDDEHGKSNAVAMLEIEDPLGRVIFEGHTYFDFDNSGQNVTCVGPDIGVKRLEPFTRWLRENNKRGFVGEFGASARTVCLMALANTAQYLLKNRDVYVGWAYWAAGPKWPREWPFLLEPGVDGADAPQMRALLDYLNDN